MAWLFSHNRGVALDATPLLFHVFERYQLALAAVALLTLVLWRSSGRRRTKTLAVAATLLATGLAFLQIAVITPTITATQNTDRPKFDTYHHLASANYTTVAVLVMVGLVLSLTAIRRDGRPA